MLTASHSFHFDSLFPQQEGKKVETFISSADHEFVLQPTSSTCTFLSMKLENSWSKDVIVVPATDFLYSYTRTFREDDGIHTHGDGEEDRIKKLTHRMRRLA